MTTPATQPVEPQHAPEPWRDSANYTDKGTNLIDGNGDPIALLPWGNGNPTDADAQAAASRAEHNARRIVAAVNFCREFSTDFLESHRLLFHPGPQLPGECKALVPIAINETQPSAPQGATS